MNTSDLVYLQSSHDLRYDSLWIWSSSSQKSGELYRTRDPTCNLEIKRLEDGSVAILETDFETVRLGLVESKSLHWLAKGKDILPVTKSVYYVDQKEQDPIEAQSIRGGWTVKRSFGLLTIYDRDEKPITTVWGEVTADTRDPTRLFISDVRYEPYWMDTTTWSLSNPLPYPFTVTYTPEPAPTFVIRPTTQEIKGLLVTAYGAYGIPTKAGSLVSRWHPLLKAGWAIASVLVPGGGDHTQRWREKGQRLGRQKSIETLRQVVVDLQEDLGVDSAKTVLYGRSAGGLLVSSTAIINRGLVGGLYIESPYIDVLRTISNPELPLTLLETKEFGIGTDFINVVETAQWSPMEHLPVQGIPELFVIARTDEQDLQVYPYEVVKFIQRARGTTNSGRTKLLQISKGKGHFATTNKTMERLKRLFEDRIHIIREFSSKAISQIPDQIDFLYIDGNHSYPFVKQDLELYYPKLKSTGYILGDDAVDIIESKRNENGDVRIDWPTGCFGHYGVIKAFQEFIIANKLEGSIIGTQYLIRSKH